MMRSCVPVDIVSLTRVESTDDLEIFAYTHVVEVTKELLLAWKPSRIP